MFQRAKYLIPVAAAAAFLVFALPSGSADPSDSWSLQSRVPGSTLAMVSMEDVGTWEKRLAETGIGQLMQDDEMQAFLEPISKFLHGQMEEAQGGMLREMPPIMLDMVKQLTGLSGQLAFALIDVDMDQEVPELAMSLDFGTNLADFVTFLGRVKTELGEDGDAIESFDRDGRTWWQINTGGPVISATTIDTTFVVAMNPETLQGIIGGAPAQSLASSPSFAHCWNRSGGDDLGMFVFANVEAVLAKFGDEMPREMQTIANTLGLDTAKGASYGIAFKGKSFQESLLLHTPGATHGLSALALAPPAAPKMLKHVPANAFYYAESNIQISELMGRMRGLLARVDGDMAQSMDRGLAEASEALGMDIEKEVLSQFGDGLGLYASMPRGGGLYPELVISAAVGDGFEPMFTKFCDNLAGMVSEQRGMLMSTRTMPYAGHTMHLMDLQLTRGDDPLPFTPTWIVADGRMWMTLVPYTMKEFLLGMADSARSTGPQGLAAQTDFAELMADHGGPAGAYEYVDLQAIMAMLYDTAAPLAQTVLKPNVMGDAMPFKLDFAKLPPASKIRKHFGSMLAFSTWSKDGLEISIRGPIPVVALAAVAAGAMATYFMRGMGRSMRGSSAVVEIGPMPTRTPAVGNDALKREMAVLTGEEHRRFVELYILEHGKMPTSLQDLVKSAVRRSVPKDPWGHEYRLEIRDAARREFVIRSPGPDGRFGSSDDVAVAGN